MEEQELKKPIGDFIIKNAKGTQTQNGVYYHYSEVCSLLKSYEKQLRIGSVSQQRELLLAFDQHCYKSLGIKEAEGDKIMIEDFLANYSG